MTDNRTLVLDAAVAAIRLEMRPRFDTMSNSTLSSTELGVVLEELGVLCRAMHKLEQITVSGTEDAIYDEIAQFYKE